MSAIETPLGTTHIHECGELTVVGPLAHQMDVDEQQAQTRQEVRTTQGQKAGAFALGILHYDTVIPWGSSHDSNL